MTTPGQSPISDQEPGLRIVLRDARSDWETQPMSPVAAADILAKKYIGGWDLEWKVVAWNKHAPDI